jgi:hypothetical protein
MLSKHLIFVVVFLLTFAIIYGSFFKYGIFAAEGDVDCLPDVKDKTVVYCCYEHEEHHYCATCLQRSDGTWSCGSFDRMDFQVPDDNGISPKGKGLFGLLDENTPPVKPGEESTGKGKGLLGLLDNTNPTIQQPQQSLPETTIPQKDFPKDLLSNFEDDFSTNIPKKDSEPSNLLEENEQQESPRTETDNTDNENIIKEDSKDNEQDNNNQIYCIRAPCPNSNSNDNQDQLSENQEDEIKSEEDEKEDSNEGEQEQEQ